MTFIYYIRYFCQKKFYVKLSAHEKMKTMCLESNIRYFEIDGDYEQEVAKIYQWVDELWNIHLKDR